MSYNVMILDDDREAAEQVRLRLEQAGLDRIDIIADVHAAIAMLRAKKYHVLLADMDMPDMDGVEILRKVRQYDPMTQVIMMTEHSTIDRVLTCLELGANDYVLKPFKNDEYLTDIIRAAVGKLERWKEAVAGTVLKEKQLADAVQ
jgi:DNA-binding response OmpR family regulator